MLTKKSFKKIVSKLTTPFYIVTSVMENGNSRKFNVKTYEIHDEYVFIHTVPLALSTIRMIEKLDVAIPYSEIITIFK